LSEGGPKPIPFNRPCLVGRELEHVADSFRRMQISGDGYFTKACQDLLSEMVGGSRVLLTTSCTHALEMAALLLDLGPGDEVLMPAFTFVSTANAFALRGARPVFCDVREDTLNLDERRLAERASPRTRAVVPVHYAGVGCAMDAILAFAAERGVTVVEDNAHGLCGRYAGRPLGTFGRLATLSFHETKNFTSGEGGALVLNDASLVERAEILREKGTNRSRFFRGEVDKYTWVDVGSSYVASDLLAALLFGQLEAADRVQRRRREIWTFYRDALGTWAEAHGVRLPVVPPECETSCHLFHLLLPDARGRDGLIAHLKARGIQSVFHYLPLNASPMGERFGARRGDCPVAESASERLLRLPLFHDLGADDLERVADGVRSFRP
jgi:dTDP-4-amino-4,6-dideoxygalactose transaminase